MTDTDTPLAGLEVLDLSTMVSGGFTTVMLADFGAEVLSVEHPDYNDPVRDWSPDAGGDSFYWKNLGRNKKHISLDLSTEKGQELARSLAADVDIVVENFRPGTMERWNLGYDSLSERNESLVMVRLSGYGQTGPRATKPGFGTIAESLSTFSHINGFGESPPLSPPIPLADLTAGMFAVQGAMFALYARDNGGQSGQVIDVSLFEPLFRLMIGDVEAYDTNGVVPTRTGNRDVRSSPRNLYETADGYIALSASSQNIFENVMAGIGRSDLVDDPRFRTNADRVEHADAIDRVIGEWCREHSTDEAIAKMESAGAVVGPVYDIADTFADAQYQARDDMLSVPDEQLGDVATHAPVPKLSETPGEVRHLGGEHGQHNRAVYRERLGLTKEEYQQLRSEEVI
ncbi:CaiB/BaiF CoA-transferase family protein [Halococcus sp. IIIV-5B]|uniref:CaiB/BaiF CoA transferase family protein n=1 Tax=Halococcus sp. IIIV-5B TaxID=2321230 RepID=UPI000E72E3DA|nr:CoA transferase [Halococcus sp. IIIV-5B]RJT07974.1 CoA transferase [Halococcus sp. IIIV-5B]